MATSSEGVSELDIVIPVYNEGENIRRALDAIDRHTRTSARILICYDRDDDTTLAAIEASGRPWSLPIVFVKNRGKGALGAIVTGLSDSTAPAVLVWMADDDYNAPRIDAMVERFRQGADIVAASRFMPGGCMEGCPLLKATLVRTSAAALHHVARIPTHDPTNSLRLFSRRIVDSIPIESVVGFAFSIELLVKAKRLGWRIDEIPAEWYERTAGKSRFQVIRWLPQYLTWFGYAFETTYLRRGPSTVRLRT